MTDEKKCACGHGVQEFIILKENDEEVGVCASCAEWWKALENESFWITRKD